MPHVVILQPPFTPMYLYGRFLYQPDSAMLASSPLSTSLPTISSGRLTIVNDPLT